MGHSSLRDAPIESGVHVCVDMQKLFAAGDWALPWMPRVLPRIAAICESHATRTIFTRFLPVERAGQGTGTWKRYYERWSQMTLDRIGRDKVELVPELARYTPPAAIADKQTFSPWADGVLRRSLHDRGVRTLVVTGGETDMCVLATVIGATDFGYRVIVVTDALCSTRDDTHDAMLDLFSRRYSEHIETGTTEEVLSLWQPN